MLKYRRGVGFLVGMVLGFSLTISIRTSLISGTFSQCFKKFKNSASEMSSQNLVDENSNEPNKNLVFVGVMTAQKYLDTRALAVYRTWGQTLPGKLAFFSSAGSEKNCNIPLVSLPGVDDSYPPQKKSFMMIKYMHDHFIDKYEWFMRADDDVYIRGNKLEEFLRSINSSKPQFIGQAGMGNKEEFGLLSLEYDENFCMGGPGMIMSRETLRRMVPHIKYCLKNLYSTHEDVEIGRCVRKFAEVPCTWSYEMQNIFYHNSSGADAYTGNLKTKEVHRAITLHPIKKSQYQYRAHNYFKGLQTMDLHHNTLILHRDIHDMNINLKEKQDTESNSLGLAPNLNKFQPEITNEVLTWEFFTKSIFSDKNVNPKRGLENSLKQALNDIVMQIMDMINKFSRQRGRVIDFKDILYGYRRVDPIHGADYLLDLLLVYKKYRGRKMTAPVRRHAYIQQSFTQLEFMEDEEEEFPYETKNQMHLINKIKQGLDMTLGKDEDFKSVSIQNKVIHFILPLSGRFLTFQRFLKNFEDICLKNDEQVKLAVILFNDNNENENMETKGLISMISNKYLKYEIKVIEIKGPFQRALACELGAAQYSSDSLLFFVDVDIAFNKAFLERVRINTRQHYQVYYPIVFSQFDPMMVYGNKSGSPDYFLINKDNGYWRQFGFGIVATYNSDLSQVGGFDTSIVGWGKEDVDLFEKFIHSNITIFRAVDTGLVHVFHIINCDQNIEPAQYDMCLGTQASSYASLSRLAEIVYGDENLLNAEHYINGSQS